jgi:hypothetical protein
VRTLSALFGGSMIFYAVNNTGKKVKVSVPGYGMCVFSPGETRVFEDASDRRYAVSESGLDVLGETSFKSEVIEHVEEEEDETSGVEGSG